jgi:amino acid transporter
LRGAKLPQQSAKLPEATSILLFVFVFVFFFVKGKKTQRRERNKEENSSFFFILLLPYFFFFLILLVIFYFFRIGVFFPFASSPHVFVRARWFILTLFMFCHHSCSMERPRILRT